MSSRFNSRTKILAAIVIFAAIYAVLRRIPTVPMIGVQGASFSASDAIAPLYGIILGPYAGGISVLIGTFIGMALGKAPVFLGLDFLPAVVNAVALGFLARKKWAPVVLLYVVLLLAFILNPMTSLFINVPWGSSTIAFPFIWLHIIALIVLLSPLGWKAGAWVESLKPAKLVAGIGVLAFIGTMMQHLMGNILYETVFGPVLNYYTAADFATTVWPVSFYLYPWERLGLIALTLVIGIPLVRVLKKTFFPPDKPSDKTSAGLNASQKP